MPTPSRLEKVAPVYVFWSSLSWARDASRKLSRAVDSKAGLASVYFTILIIIQSVCIELIVYIMQIFMWEKRHKFQDNSFFNSLITMSAVIFFSFAFTRYWEKL